MIMKNRSNGYYINKPCCGHRHKYIKSKNCHGKIRSVCIKKHL